MRSTLYTLCMGLAAAAAALGMRPSETPVFLDLSTPESGVTNG